MLLEPADESEALHEIAHWFAGDRQLQMLVVGPTSNEHRKYLLEEAARKEGLFLRASATKAMMPLHLPPSWEAFHARLGNATRMNTSKVERRLMRDLPGIQWEVLTEFDAYCEVVFDELVRLFRLRWGQQLDGCFLDVERNVAYYREAMRLAMMEGYTAISVLKNEGKVVALSIFILPHQDAAHFHIIARDTEAMPNYYSPGIYLYLQTFRWEITRGTSTMYIGTGSNDYKVLLGAHEEPVRETALTRSPVMRKVVPVVERGLYVCQRLPVHLHYQWQRARASLR